MSPRFAPASLFRAGAIAALPDDSWAVEGVHLRVRVSPWLGFPIHAFAAWRLPAPNPDDVVLTWRGAHGTTLVAPFDLDEAGGEAIGTLAPGGQTGDREWVWLELDVADGGLRVDLLDGLLAAGGEPRILATRTREPFRFGSTAISQIRVSGSGRVYGARGIHAGQLDLEPALGGEPEFTFGLPLEAGPWYGPDPRTDPRDDARRRVEQAAPSRLAPPDNPLDVWPGTTDPQAEANRIIDVIGPEWIDEPWLRPAFADPGRHPRDAVLTADDGAPPPRTQTVSAPVTPTLLTMAVDPQFARYLGLATWRSPDEAAPLDPAAIWLIAGRWAVQRRRVVVADPIAGAHLRLRRFLDTADEVWDGIVDRLDDLWRDDRNRIERSLRELPPDEEGGEWTVAPLLAVAVAAGEAPPDPPDPPRLALDRGGWNARPRPVGGDVGPETWGQAIAFTGQPARGMIGVARMRPEGPDGPLALHRFAPEPGGNVPSRALPLLPEWASNGRRLVTDREIPVEPAGASWWAWQADEFGRWSAVAEGAAKIEAPLPARPRPRPPQPELSFTPATDDGSTDLRVPGTLHLRIEVPVAADGEPGSRDVVLVGYAVDGVWQDVVEASPGETIHLDADPRPFALGEARPVVVTATFTDSDGVESEEGVARYDVFDPRAPRPIATSPVLIWTGEPDAIGQAQLALRWPAVAGAAGYRVYLGDERRLAADRPIDLSGMALRAERADAIHEIRAALTEKRLFTLLNETPVTADGDGVVRFIASIPGTLRGVQFARVVPLSAAQAEAPFAACGLVPVAVPGLDRPPPPALTAETDPVAGLTLRIEARGLRPDLLAAGAGKPPEFRLRRTARDLADPRYAPPVDPPGVGALAGPDASGAWMTTVAVPAADLPPFVRVAWYAEVRYPAEPPIPPGSQALPADGGVGPLWGEAGRSAGAVWSAPSLPAESLLLPPASPPAPAGATATRNADGTVTIAVPDLPVAHPLAIARYLVEIYRSRPSAAPPVPPTVVATVPTGDAAFAWTDVTAPAEVDLAYDLILLDPAGRRSAPVRVAMA